MSLHLEAVGGGKKKNDGDEGNGNKWIVDKSKFLTPSHAFSSEKIRGAITSVVSGGVSGFMNLLGVTTFGLSAPLSAFFFLYIFGSVFGYTVDILFAKAYFTIKDGNNSDKPFHGRVPYTDMRTRVLWLLRSFIDKHFFRFVITVILDTLIGIAILQALIDYMNHQHVLMDFAYRDMLLAGGVSIFTFFLYNNVLRFDWAYSDTESPLMNVLVLMWVGIVLLVFAVAYSLRTERHSSNKDDDKPVTGYGGGNEGNIFYTAVSEENAEQKNNKGPDDLLARALGGGSERATSSKKKGEDDH